MLKIPIGSSVTKLKNCKDIDYLVVDAIDKLEYEEGADYIYMSSSRLKSLLSFEIDSYLLLFNYEYDNYFNNILDYNLLDYRDKLIEVLKNYVLFHDCTKCCYVKDNKKFLIKIYYHIAYNLFILENNSVKLTDEQLEIVQKIHDKEMPVEYGEELKQRILNLK